VPRGKRKKEKPQEKTEIREIDAQSVSRELKKRWSPLSWIFDFGFPVNGTKRKRTELDVVGGLFSP
jgi:hypothetical protein